MERESGRLHVEERGTGVGSLLESEIVVPIEGQTPSRVGHNAASGRDVQLGGSRRPEGALRIDSSEQRSEVLEPRGPAADHANTLSLEG